MRVYGDANYTLVQVSVNDLILVFAFAPIAGLLLGVTDLQVPWETLVASVVIFVVIPLGAGILTHQRLIKSGGIEAIERLAGNLKLTSIVGLLLTVVLLFGFQADTIVQQPGRVVLIAVPLLIQSYGIFAIAYGLARMLKLPHDVAAPAATSNFESARLWPEAVGCTARAAFLTRRHGIHRLEARLPGALDVCRRGPSMMRG